MKKSTMINKIYQDTDMPESDIELVVNAALEIITDTLKSGDSVSLYGFGSFSLVKRKAKELYVPGTQTKIKVPEKRAIKFTPSNKLKSYIETIDNN